MSECKHTHKPGHVWVGETNPPSYECSLCEMERLQARVAALVQTCEDLRRANNENVRTVGELHGRATNAEAQLKTARDLIERLNAGVEASMESHMGDGYSDADVQLGKLQDGDVAGFLALG